MADLGVNSDKMSRKAERQLKELRRLMPWNWDSRVEEHPPGEKAMQDFEDVVNYRIDGRKRRNVASQTGVLSVVQPKQRKEKNAAKKVKKVSTKDDAGDNKENIPPVCNLDPSNENEIKLPVTIEIGTQKMAADSAAAKEQNTPAVAPPVTLPCTAMTPAHQSNAKKVSVIDVMASPITPGFILTPATEQKEEENAVAKRKVDRSRESKMQRTSKQKTLSGCEKVARLSEGSKQKKKQQTRRVSFCETPVIRKPQIESPANIVRAVNFGDDLCIDIEKYRSGIKVKRPRGCPPLFRDHFEAHGRRTLPAVVGPRMALASVPGNAQKNQPLQTTPYRSRNSDRLFAREGVLARIIQNGLQLKGAAHTSTALPPLKPLDASSKLTWACSQLYPFSKSLNTN